MVEVTAAPWVMGRPLGKCDVAVQVSEQLTARFKVAVPTDPVKASSFSELWFSRRTRPGEPGPSPGSLRTTVHDLRGSES